LRCLDHTLTHTVGRTPLGELSARSEEFYLTIYNTYKRQISIPPDGIRTPNLNKRAAPDGDIHYPTKFISNLKSESQTKFDILGIYRAVFTDTSPISSTQALKGTLGARYKRR